MTIARILSGTGLTTITATVLAHGEHGSMMVTQLLSHSLAVSTFLFLTILEEDPLILSRKRPSSLW